MSTENERDFLAHYTATKEGLKLFDAFFDATTRGGDMAGAAESLSLVKNMNRFSDDAITVKKAFYLMNFIRKEHNPEITRDFQKNIAQTRLEMNL